MAVDRDPLPLSFFHEELVNSLRRTVSLMLWDFDPTNSELSFAEVLNSFDIDNRMLACAMAATLLSSVQTIESMALITGYDANNIREQSTYLIIQDNASYYAISPLQNDAVSEREIEFSIYQGKDMHEIMIDLAEDNAAVHWPSVQTITKELDKIAGDHVDCVGDGLTYVDTTLTVISTLPNILFTKIELQTFRIIDMPLS